MIRTNKGFTLIELLVVIAIIGIIAAVVLASLNIARGKGADAAIKADLDTIRKQAAIYEDTNHDYGADANNDCTAGMFSSDPNISAALAHAATASGNPAVCFADDVDPAAGTSATSWAVAVPLKTDATASWCVDSKDFAGVGVADIITITDVASCH